MARAAQPGTREHAIAGSEYERYRKAYVKVFLVARDLGDEFDSFRAPNDLPQLPR